MFITNYSVGRYGRFANLLFQVASGIGIALHPKNNCDYKFPLLINYDALERFGSTEPINIYEYFENPLPLLTEADKAQIQYERHINWGYHDVIINGNTALFGHFQSLKYFDHCIDIVRYYLRMKKEYGLTDYVAIHFRAGDYDPNPNAYHPRCGIGYYHAAMKYFEPGTKYLVFTDDIPAAKEMFSDTVDYCHADYLKSFSVMKSCRHFICANSSYSLMAAILSESPDKKVVLPKKWFGEVAGLDTKDLYPPNSIVI